MIGLDVAEDKVCPVRVLVPGIVWIRCCRGTPLSEPNNTEKWTQNASLAVYQLQYYWQRMSLDPRTTGVTGPNLGRSTNRIT